jgi:hypothetical protein
VTDITFTGQAGTGGPYDNGMRRWRREQVAVITQAAGQLRARADAAAAAVGGDWHLRSLGSGYPQPVWGRGGRELALDAWGGPVHAHDVARYAAALGPATGLRIALLLEVVAVRARRPWTSRTVVAAAATCARDYLEYADLEVWWPAGAAFPVNRTVPPPDQLDLRTGPCASRNTLLPVKGSPSDDLPE